MSESKNLVAQLRQDRKVLWIALACGALAALLLFLYINSVNKSYGEMVPVVVASRTLNPGDKLDEKAVRFEHRPADFVNVDFVGPRDQTVILGKEIKTLVPAGQPILWSYLEYQDSFGVLSSGLDAKSTERAVAIAVDEIKGVGGHLKPGDRVDVIGTFTVPNKTANGMPDMKTKTLLQCVTVLAVGSNAGNGQTLYREAPSSVTLKLAPEEADLVIFAEKYGQLTLVLRSPDDVSTTRDVAEIDFSNIFSFPTINSKRLIVINGQSARY